MALRNLTRATDQAGIARPIVTCLFAFLASGANATQAPFILASSCSFAANNGRCQGNVPIAPATQANAVLVFATAQCEPLAVDQPTLWLKVTMKGAGQNVDFQLAPSSTTVRPQSRRTTTIFTHPIRIPLKGFTQMDYEFQALNSGVAGTCSLTIQAE